MDGDGVAEAWWGLVNDLCGYGEGLRGFGHGVTIGVDEVAGRELGDPRLECSIL